MSGPCNGTALDWQRAVAALSRASGRYAEALSKASGDRAEAARLLWARSRHDKALKEDLVKAGCAVLALFPDDLVDSVAMHQAHDSTPAGGQAPDPATPVSRPVPVRCNAHDEGLHRPFCGRSRESAIAGPTR